MKKQTLLGAVALTTVIVGAAGAANAQQYTVVSSTLPPAATVKAARTVASEITLTGTNSKGVLGIAVTPSGTAILPGGNSVLTLTLTGGHTFGTAVTPGAIVGGVNTCAPTTTISTGGLATDSTVSFLLSGLGGCTTANPILVALPAQLANTTTSVGLNTTFKTELGTGIDGGSASYNNGSSVNAVVAFAKAFKVNVVADTTLSAATLGSGFRTLTEGSLGTVAVVADTTAFAGIQTGAANVAQADITNASYKFVGSQSATAASLTFNAVGVTPTTGVIAIASPAATAFVAAAVPVTPTLSTNPIPASTYTVAVDLTLAAAYAAQPTFGPSSLQSITREGTTYLIPWVSSGTLANSTGNSTVVRISNISGVVSGAVSAELLTSSTGVAASTTLVPLAASIAKGGEAIITGASLETAIGSNFGRGDIRLTVESLPAGLIARRFIQSVTNGSLTEVSLGRTIQGGVPSEPIN